MKLLFSIKAIKDRKLIMLDSKKEKLPEILKRAIIECKDALIGIMEVEEVGYTEQMIIFRGKVPLISDEKIEFIREKILKLGYLPLIERNGGDNIILRIWGAFREITVEKFPWINLVLFVLTVFTTLIAGAMMEGAMNPFTDFASLAKGIPFSFTLIMILGCHEFGHYYFSKKHNIKATLPYFIPAPPVPYLFTIGTFGAFIKMKEPARTRRALFDVGVAGPIAGFCIALPAVIFGLLTSEVVDMRNVKEPIHLGDSLLMALATKLIYGNLPEGFDIILNNVAFAGWIGLLVTAINLLPLGQLDGGHIFYAMFGKKHEIIAKVVFIGLIALSFISYSWIIWVLLILFLIKVKHPPTLDDDIPLDNRRMLVGWISILIFILCFIPVPVKI
jgi:membrane-associated protease RseP (regulator of RpoE activity)